MCGEDTFFLMRPPPDLFASGQVLNDEVLNGRQLLSYSFHRVAVATSMSSLVVRAGYPMPVASSAFNVVILVLTTWNSMKKEGAMTECPPSHSDVKRMHANISWRDKTIHHGLVDPY